MNEDISLLVIYALLAVVLSILLIGVARAIRRQRDLTSAGAKLTTEIEGRAAAEVSQRESDDNFLRFVEGVTDYAIYRLDPRGCVTTWNAGAERIKGYTAAEILGRHISCFYTAEDQARGEPARVLEIADRDGRFESEDTIQVRKDGGRFHASVVIDRLSDPSGRLLGFAKITHDIDERVAQATALEEARAALAQSQKVEAIGHLTGGIEHDFNNMLAVIIGALNMMQRRIGRGDYNVEPLVQAAVEGAMRGASLTQRLLAFARKQVLEPRTIDANKLLSGMSDLVRRALGETIQTEIITEGGL